jgi:ParB-like chromosome segregation protein Spo0J
MTLPLAASRSHGTRKRGDGSAKPQAGIAIEELNVAQSNPPLKLLHSSLIKSKLDAYAKKSDQELIDSLRSGQPGSLKVRPDGTIVDGNRRIKILRDRGVKVDALPREIIPKDPIADPP